jgi:prevent-host-death family protein
LSYNLLRRIDAMPVKVSAADARNHFSELLGRARFGRESFVVEKQGKPFAVILGLEEYQRLVEAASRAGALTAELSGGDGLRSSERGIHSEVTDG